jgi:hypothetical protein
MEIAVYLKSAKSLMQKEMNAYSQTRDNKYTALAIVGFMRIYLIF